jgi:hypothetical protein
MATTALRYSVLSLLCHVGFAEVDPQASQQDCFRVMPEEIDLDFSEATLRSNNLGGMGPGPGQCNASLPAGDPGQSDRCGFNDLDPSHPYYNKMVFGNVVSRATSDRLGAIAGYPVNSVVDLVVSNTTEYLPYSAVYNGLSDGKAFGNLNVDGIAKPNNGEINEITLKFELHVRPPVGEGSQTPINMPYIKFSLFDFDENPNAKGRECVDASGYYAYAHSVDSADATKTTLQSSNQAYDSATGDNSGATNSPVPCACQLLEP